MKKVIKVVVYFDYNTFEEVENNYYTSTPKPLPEPLVNPTKIPKPYIPKSSPDHPDFGKEPWPLEPLSKLDCPQCGIKLEGVMGYYCPHDDCPCGLGGVRCFSRDIT